MTFQLFRGCRLRSNQKVLAARIRALRSKDQSRQNVAEVLRGSGAKRPGRTEPRAATSPARPTEQKSVTKPVRRRGMLIFISPN
jgi:hypothetical protein